MFKRIQGTKDILPEECLLWQKIERTSRNIFSLYNFVEIKPPLIEEASLFNRSLGETTEVVQKQMFLIKNKEETYALRPEGTASVARAYIENSLDKSLGFLKLYYMGPMFRLERPQRGRLRQFHHIGCEAIGSHDPYLDVEIITLADVILKAISITGYKIKLNSLGCKSDKKKLSDFIRSALKKKAGDLCEECQRRLDKNVLRILDCKNELCRNAVLKSGLEFEYLCKECKEHFSVVKSGLDSLGVRYEISPYLVRGLDYYTGTVFEITHEKLGAQDALGAGGRYDNLVKELGGAESGAIGFAFGIERLVLVCGEINNRLDSMRPVYIITMGEAARIQGLKLMHDLRNDGIACDTDYEAKSLKGSMRVANDLGARHVLLIGENEIKNEKVTLKDMSTGEQKEINYLDIKKELACSRRIPAES